MPGAAATRMTAADVVASAVALAIAGWVFVESARWPVPADAGNPATVPRGIAAILAACALALLLRAVRGRSEILPADPEGSGVARVGAAFLAAVGYVALLEPLGFIPATMAFLAAFSVAVGSRRYAVIAVFALAMPLAMWLLFGRVLRVPLPPVTWL